MEMQTGAVVLGSIRAEHGADNNGYITVCSCNYEGFQCKGGSESGTRSQSFTVCLCPRLKGWPREEEALRCLRTMCSV